MQGCLSRQLLLLESSRRLVGGVVAWYVLPPITISFCLYTLCGQLKVGEQGEQFVCATSAPQFACPYTSFAVHTSLIPGEQLQGLYGRN